MKDQEHKQIVKRIMDGWKQSLNLNKKMLREMKLWVWINLLLYVVWFLLGMTWGIIIAR